MFRLIATALVSTFTLLAIAAPEQSAAPPSVAAIRSAVAPASQLRIGSNYLVAVPVGLRQRPAHDTQAVARLPTGAPVVVLANAPWGYAQVRDDAGRTGYVPVSALADML